VSGERAPIPLVDLRAAFAPIREEVLAAIGEILDSGRLLLGPNVEAFEREFAAYCGAPLAIGLSSGTDAVYAALRATGVGPGDEVIAPAHTFFATIEAIVHTGAMPVLVDVEPERLTIDPERVRAALTARTRAIVPVHLYGHPADMEPLLTLAGERGLRVIEDAAQAHGASYRGRRCGSLGDVGCFSFYFTKNLGAAGEAGCATTGDPGLAEQLRRLRHHGHVSKFEHALVGHNFRLDELQAAVLRIRLRRLDRALARRRAIAGHYGARFLGSPVVTLPTADGCEAGHHLYPVRVRDRDGLAAHLQDRGIQTGIHYPVPAHRQPALRDHPHRVEALPVTEAACRELLSLPIYPELEDEQVERIAACVLDFVGAEPASASRVGT
jgi:dTDP-4-amino-4,6-dideoxygalactose transaminase